MTWTCLGIPPTTPPCDAHGNTDRDAEKHTKTTQHATTSGQPRGVDAISSHVHPSALACDRCGRTNYYCRCEVSR